MQYMGNPYITENDKDKADAAFVSTQVTSVCPLNFCLVDSSCVVLYCLFD